MRDPQRKQSKTSRQEEENTLPRLNPHAPTYLHNIDYQKFGHSKIGGIMSRKYRPDQHSQEKTVDHKTRT